MTHGKPINGPVRISKRERLVKTCPYPKSLIKKSIHNQQRLTGFLNNISMQ
jgi:hypothetical protein